MVQKYTYLEIYLNDLSKLISLSEFESYFKRPHQTIKRHLKVFVDENILIEEKREKFLFYKLNLNNNLIFDYLVICEKERLFEFLKNSIFKRFYESITSVLHKKKFLIFGSSVDSKKFEDIDLLVISRSKSSELLKELKKFEKTYSIKVHLVLTSKKNISKTFKEELIKKHIILNRCDYFVKFLYF